MFLRTVHFKEYPYIRESKVKNSIFTLVIMRAIGILCADKERLSQILRKQPLMDNISVTIQSPLLKAC